MCLFLVPLAVVHENVPLAVSVCFMYLFQYLSVSCTSCRICLFTSYTSCSIWLFVSFSSCNICLFASYTLCNYLFASCASCRICVFHVPLTLSFMYLFSYLFVSCTSYTICFMYLLPYLFVSCTSYIICFMYLLQHLSVSCFSCNVCLLHVPLAVCDCIFHSSLTVSVCFMYPLQYLSVLCYLLQHLSASFVHIYSLFVICLLMFRWRDCTSFCLLFNLLKSRVLSWWDCNNSCPADENSWRWVLYFTSWHWYP